MARQRFNIRYLLAVALAIGLGVWIYRDQYATYHFAEVTPKVLYRSGNKDLHLFATGCRKGNIKTVVMLNDDKELGEEPFKSEVDFCREKGIKLVRIPVPLGGRPTAADVQRFLETVKDPANQPVLVHCAQGVRRTAMMVAAYQEAQLGLTPAQAKEAILPWGRKPTSHTLEDIRGFIDDYNPATGALASANATTRPIDTD